ncbi:MAG TPA: SIS domain-containing protein [Armatimonadetes bacterium]|jgi:D-sedoheptulose 7-phosphate isomerase|nr:SIS domain-containing protein [Armatimonadota bacterium]
MGRSVVLSPMGYLERVVQAAREVDPAEVDALAGAIAEAYQAGRFVFIVGNGGSGANASHLCEDLGKGTLSDFQRQKRLKVLSLTDNTPYLLAWGNDTSFERVFVEQLRNLAGPGDLLIAISGSGNSPNILRAVEYANRLGLHTFGVTGFDGGRLREIAHACLHVPCDDMGVVEAIHAIFFHYLVDALRLRFQGEAGA